MDTTPSAIEKSTIRKVSFRLVPFVALMFFINYLDRTVISVAAPLLSRDLGLSAVAMGVVFSAFSWTYAAAQILGDNLEEPGN